MMRALAFAPATVANLAVGFDVLGLAVDGLGERVQVEKIKEPIIRIQAPEGIPTDPHQNTATLGLLKMQSDLRLKHGFHVTIEKKIPQGSGLGGSATSAVAAVLAASSLVSKKLSEAQLLSYALDGEAIASGARHADNVGPCLRGGMVLVDHQGPQLTSIPVPPSFRVVLLLPNLSVKTSEARSRLNASVPLPQFVQQTRNLAGFLLGLQKKDLSLIRSSLKDVVIEPQRAALVPGFEKWQSLALGAGALGCSLSGSGPALFALAESEAKARKVLRAWKEEQARQPGSIRWCSVHKISRQGARLVKGSLS